MDANIDIKKMLHRLRFRGKGGPRTPVGDWRMLVACFLLVNAVIVAGSIYLFFALSDEAGDTGSAPKIEALNEKGLDKVVGAFAEKKQSFESLKTSKSGSLDPSI